MAQGVINQIAQHNRQAIDIAPHPYSIVRKGCNAIQALLGMALLPELLRNLLRQLHQVHLGEMCLIAAFRARKLQQAFCAMTQNFQRMQSGTHFFQRYRQSL